MTSGQGLAGYRGQLNDRFVTIAEVLGDAEGAVERVGRTCTCSAQAKAERNEEEGEETGRRAIGLCNANYPD